MKSNGKVALVVGATGGIGLPITIALLRAGIKVLGTARTRDNLDRLRHTIKYSGPDLINGFIGITLDLNDLYSTANFGIKLTASEATLDHVIFAVGHRNWNLVSELEVKLLSLEGLESMANHYDLFIHGLISLIDQVLPVMQTGGSITVIGSSIANVKPKDVPPDLHSIAGYAAIKAAQALLVEYLRFHSSITKKKLLLHYLTLPGVLDTPFHTTAPRERQLQAGTTTRAVASAILTLLDASKPTSMEIHRQTRSELGLDPTS